MGMQMDRLLQFYIDGAWVTPERAETLPFENPATEEVVAHLALGDAAWADRAVDAARAAFPSYSQSPLSERTELLARVRDAFAARMDELAAAMTLEIGAPSAISRSDQAGAGLALLDSTLEAANSFDWERRQGATRLLHEPVGVCALITPWNWPIAQVVAKVAPALVSGCTVVLKPSEVSPLSATIFTEIIDEAGVPRGIYNMVQGLGPVVGERIASHPDVDMASFTGSTRAGVAVATAAAPTVKRVTQELGGKSANLILPGADVPAAVAAGVRDCYFNS